jgi:hypothetical protein
MDLLQAYKGDSSSSDECDDDVSMSEGEGTSGINLAPNRREEKYALALPKVDLAPQVIAHQPIQTVAVVDPKTKELYYNPKYEELFQPEVFKILHIV